MLRASINNKQEEVGGGADLLPLIEQMPVAVAVFDRSMNYLAVSRPWLEAYGRRHTDLVGKNYYQVHPGTPAEWKRLHQEILLGGDLHVGEDSWVRSDGSRHWVKWHARPWRDQGAVVRGLIISAEDITRQKEIQIQLETARAAAQRAGKLLDEAVASIPHGFVIYDPEDRLLQCNEAYLGYYGACRDLMVPGTPFAEIIRRKAERGVYPLAAGQREEWVEERLAQHRRADGRAFEQQLADGRWLLATEVRTPSGCIVGNRIDITERKAVEEKLRRSATVIGCVQEGIVITDARAVIVEINAAFSRITEYAEAELLGQPMKMLQSGRHDRAFYQNIWDSLAASGAWQGEIWNRRKSGEIYLEWLSISAIRDEDGQVRNYVGITTDLSRMQHAQSELERLAHHDALTRLPNRLLLMSRLEHALDRKRRYGGQGAVLFVDLDHFKAINDRLGHKAGDELLQLASERMARRLRDTDTLARLGGDEFIVVLEDVAGPEGAARVARDLVGQLGRPFTLAGGEEARIGASIGIALFPDDGTGAAQLIEQADQALYAAKGAGRGTYCSWPDQGSR